MALDGNQRAQVQYNATPNVNKLNAAEQQQLLAGLQSIYGIDTAYLVANTTVVPTALAVPIGVPVATGVGTPSAAAGATTQPGVVGGTGSIS